MLEIKKFVEPANLLNEAKEFLYKNEAQNCLIFSILKKITVNKNFYGAVDPLLYTLKEDDEIIGVAIQTPPYNLLLSYPFTEKFTKDFVAHLDSKYIELPGVLAPKEAAHIFADFWANRKSLKIKTGMKQRVHFLDKVNIETIGPESRLFRVATNSDFDTVAKWFYEFMIEAVPDFPETIGEFDEFIQKKTDYLNGVINEGNVFLLEDNSSAVSMAFSHGETFNGRMIGYVYTPKDIRGKGYGTNVVARLSQNILDRGYTNCQLFTDLANPTSNSIYEKIGYDAVVYVDLLQFE